VSAAARPVIAEAMTDGAGVLRTEDSLRDTLTQLAEAVAIDEGAQPCTECWESTNLATVAVSLATAARIRTETRGSHWRDDHPVPDERWRVRLRVQLDTAGLQVSEEPVRTEEVV
jgi:succinate dehydrogenase/fumarate reductase flavoprotein subunit